MQPGRHTRLVPLGGHLFGVLLPTGPVKHDLRANSLGVGARSSQANGYVVLLVIGLILKNKGGLVGIIDDQI